MKRSRLSKEAIVFGASAIAFQLGLIGYAVNDTIQFERADRTARAAAMRFYEPVEHGGVPMTPQRAEMYKKMQKAYEGAMGKNYDLDRDPYMHLTRYR